MNKRKENEQTDTGHKAAGEAAGALMRRRVMLRGAAAAVPTILTLHSGAALARSSNLLSVADGAATDRDGRNLCVDESTVELNPGTRKAYDLGQPPQADVTAISPRTYYRDASGSGATVSPQEMCQNGGDYYYKGDSGLTSLGTAAEKADNATFGVRVSVDGKSVNEGWTKVTVPRGGLVSATALASFASAVNVRDI